MLALGVCMSSIFLLPTAASSLWRITDTYVFERRTTLSRRTGWLALMLFSCGVVVAQQAILTRSNATVVLDAFAPNIVRVTLSLDKAAALKSPGIGVTASATASGRKIRFESVVGTPLPPLRGILGTSGMDTVV
jgi:hypothetical protein